MTDRYVDTVVGASATYDPVARSATGGNDISYASILAAVAALQNNDVLFLRSGSDTPGALSVITETGVRIAVYEGEHYVLVMTDGIDALYITGAGSYIDLGTGILEFTLTGGTGGSPSALRMGVDGFNVTGTTGSIVFDVGDGSAIRADAAGTYSIRNPVFKSAYRATRILGANPTINLHNPVYIGVGHWQINAACALNLYNPTMVCPGEFTTGNPASMIDDVGGAGVVVNVYNPLFFGHGYNDAAATMFKSNNAASSITVHGGVVHQAVQKVNATNTGSGTVTVTGANNDALVKFNRQGTFYATIVIPGNEFFQNAGQTLMINDLMPVLASYGVKAVATPDDQDTWVSSNGEIANAQAWLAAGHELGTLGPSGGDDWANTAPIQISYSGAGANPRLTVSDNGETWVLETDSGVDATYDASSTGDDRFLNHVADPVGIVTKIDNLADYTASVTSTGWDDAASRTIADGVYPLSGTPTAIPEDRTRRMEIEILGGGTAIESRVGAFPTVFHCNGATKVTDAGAYAKSVGYQSCLTSNGSKGLSETMYAANSSYFVFGMNRTQVDTAFRGTDWTTLNDAQKEARIRSAVRRIASLGYWFGGYYPLEMPLPAQTRGQFTPTQIGWLVDELLTCGATIITCSQAVQLTGTNRVDETTHPVQASDSGALGLGKCWWGSTPNPTGANGEPFSNFDTDPGAVQSTHSKFHPANL